MSRTPVSMATQPQVPQISRSSGYSQDTTWQLAFGNHEGGGGQLQLWIQQALSVLPTSSSDSPQTLSTIPGAPAVGAGPSSRCGPGLVGRRQWTGAQPSSLSKGIRGKVKLSSPEKPHSPRQ